MIKTKPTIVFATMCKNEQHCIQKTLESVYKSIDYWVVCDTGSTDNTCQIIKDFFKEKGIPGELFVDEWQGFDKNKCLMMARAKDKADYILHIDADDLLFGDIVLPDDNKDAYYLLNRRGSSAFKTTILYSGKYTWRFCGVAHTIIKCVEKPQFNVGDLSEESFYIRCDPVGSRAFDPKKYFYDAERLTKQFFETLIDDPDGLNNRSVFYTAQSYFDSSMWKESMQWYRLYLKLKDTWVEECFESQMRISLCMMQLKYSKEAVHSAMYKASEMFPDRAEPLFLLGRHYIYELKDYETGYSLLKNAKTKSLEQVKQKYVLFINEKAYGKYINDDLSVACYWTGRYQEGLNLVNEIVNDLDFITQKERLTANIGFFSDKLK
jgi:glycosyltransferase involved in cell wall biosynthesis